MNASLDRTADALARSAARPDGRPDRGFLLKALAAGYAIFCATYLPINLFSVGRPAHVLYLPGEERIPLVPEFEYLYMLGYFLPLLLPARLPDIRALIQLIAAFCLTLAVAYTTYLVFPVYLERPPLEIDSLASFLLSLEYMDPSYNHFPSLHVAIAWLVYLACRDGLRRPAILLAVVLGMSVATLFVKQHYILDVLYGSLLAGGTWAAAGRWLSGYARRMGGTTPAVREAIPP